MIRIKFWYPGDEQNAWVETFTSEEAAFNAVHDALADGAEVEAQS